jgi:hypothetical protein
MSQNDAFPYEKWNLSRMSSLLFYFFPPLSLFLSLPHSLCGPKALIGI